MQTIADRIAVELVASGKPELRLTDVYGCWQRLDPKLAQSEGAGDLFLKLIFLLQANGAIQFPEKHQPYDPLPNTVLIPENIEKSLSVKSGWHPSLIFAAEKISAEDRLFLHCINDWMNARHTDRTQKVPIDERSFDIFGDERVLSDLYQASNDIFSFISLSDLRCYDLRPQLVWKQDPKGATLDVLVVETAAAYDSFCRYNAEHHIWRGVVYGQEEQFQWLHEGLQDVLGMTRSQRALYLGDITPASITLLAKVSQDYPDQVLVPYYEYYDRMLELDRKREETSLSRLGPVLIQSVHKMFPVQAEKILKMWQGKHIIPLACLGYERLIERQVAAPKGTLHWHRDDDYSNYR